MARHAGFAFVGSATQGLANKLIASVVATIPAQSFSVSGINVGGTLVNIAGTIMIFPPTVKFQQRTDDLVATTITIGGLFTISTASTSTQGIDVVLSAELDVPISTGVQNNNIITSIDLSQIVISGLGVQYLSTVPTATFQTAIASPAMVSAINAVIRALPALPVSAPLMSASISESISRGVPPGMNPPYSNRSIFPPYPNRCTISLRIGRLVTQQFDGAITIAADLAGITNGNASQLVDLTSAYSPLQCYVRTYNIDLSSTYYTTISGAPNTDAVVLVNPAVLNNVLANTVSPAFDAGPMVDDHVIIHNISVNLGWFNAGVPYGTGNGLTVTLDASYYLDNSEDTEGYFWPADAIHTPATVTIYLEVVGSDGYIPPGTKAGWGLSLVNVSVALPTWLLLPLLIPGIVIAAIAPLMIILEMAIAAAVSAALQAVLAAAQQAISQGAESLSLPNVPALTTTPIPGTNAECDIDVYRFGVSEEGVEAQLKIDQGSGAAQPSANLISQAGVSFNGADVADSGQITCLYSDPALTFNVGAPSYALIDWVATRADTGAVIVSRTSLAANPGGNVLSIPRLTAGLQAVDEFVVTIRMYVPGQIFSATIHVTVLDWISRHHPYVTWVSKTWFRDPAKPRQWRYYWSRTRQSRIHRTDFPGRCRRLNPVEEVLTLWTTVYPQVTEGILTFGSFGLDPELVAPLAHISQDKTLYAGTGLQGIAQWMPEAWSYRDSLPFATEEAAVNGRHGVLCDYCFFGGPSRNRLLVNIP